MQLFSNPLFCRGVRSVAARYLNYLLWLFKNRAATERTPLQNSGFCSFFVEKLNSYKIFSFIFFLILINFNVCAIASENLSPSDSLENTLANIQTMQANFSETITSGNQINQRLSGVFMLKRPGKFFWQTLKPIHQDIISDGQKLWIYDKDLEQIMVKSLEDNVGATPALLLNGKAGAIAKNYKVTKNNNSANKLINTYTLTPKQKTLYNYIQISFEGNTLTHMRFEDGLGQLTDFSFTQVKINAPLSDKSFIFTPPKGVDIVNG